MVLWAAVNREPGIWPVIILAVIGAIGALAVQRHVIIVATAFAGAQTAVVGAAELMGGETSTPPAVKCFTCIRSIRCRTHAWI